MKTASEMISLQEFQLQAAKLRLRIQYYEESLLQKEMNHSGVKSNVCDNNQLNAKNSFIEEYVLSDEWESVKATLVLGNKLLQKENDTIKQRNEALISSLYESKDFINQLKEDLRKEKEASDKLINDSKRQHSEIKLVDRNIKLLTSEYNMLNTQFHTLQETLNHIQTEKQLLLEDRRTQLDFMLSKNKEIEKLNEIIISLNETEARLNDQMLLQSVEHNSLKAQFNQNALTRQLNIEKCLTQSLHERLAAQTAQLVSQSVELEGFRNQVASHNATMHASMQAVKSAQQAFNSLNKSHEKALYAKNEEINELNVTVNAMKTQLQTATGAITPSIQTTSTTDTASLTNNTVESLSSSAMAVAVAVANESTVDINSDGSRNLVKNINETSYSLTSPTQKKLNHSCTPTTAVKEVTLVDSPSAEADVNAVNKTSDDYLDQLDRSPSAAVEAASQNLLSMKRDLALSDNQEFNRADKEAKRSYIASSFDPKVTCTPSTTTQSVKPQKPVPAFHRSQPVATSTTSTQSSDHVNRAVATATAATPAVSIVPKQPKHKNDLSCPCCRDQPYGLMVMCESCGTEYHSACARKSSAASSNGIEATGTISRVSKAGGATFKCKECISSS